MVMHAFFRWVAVTSALVGAGLATAASISVSAPAAPRSYESFTVQVAFDASYCVSSTYPLIGDGELRGNVFSITLSHLKPGPCTNVFSVVVPGLPAQVSRLRVAMTRQASFVGQPSVIAETAEVIHHFRATFSPRRPDRDRPTVEPDPPKVVWPSDRLPRGARMHAIVPGPDGAPMQANLISDGENLVEIDSAAGLAVLALMTAR